MRVRVDPAGVHAAAQRIGRLGIDRSEPHQTAERRLDMAAGAAEAVIEVEMAERRIQVVPPHQDDHAAPEPDTFRVTRGTVDGMRGFDKLVGLALAVLGGLSGRIRRIGGGRLVLLILGTQIAALGNRATDTEQQRETGNGKATQDRFLEPKQHSTHKVPDSRSLRSHPVRISDAAQIGPQCGGDARDSHGRHFGICPVNR